MVLSVAHQSQTNARTCLMSGSKCHSEETKASQTATAWAHHNECPATDGVALHAASNHMWRGRVASAHAGRTHGVVGGRTRCRGHARPGNGPTRTVVHQQVCCHAKGCVGGVAKPCTQSYMCPNQVWGSNHDGKILTQQWAATFHLLRCTV